MKSPSTLIALHVRAACVLELLEKAKYRLDFKKMLYAEYLKPYQMQSLSIRVSSKRKSEYVSDIINANKVYLRIKNHYLNILKKLQ